jgi:hypothetical protein
MNSIPPDLDPNLDRGDSVFRPTRASDLSVISLSVPLAARGSLLNSRPHYSKQTIRVAGGTSHFEQQQEC